nr:GNAT family N-acetyltransferase [Flavimarina sp. Hel_I_48]
MIRLARKGDIDAILKLTRACAQKMIDVGIFQWNEEYPSRAAFDNDIARQELYVLEEAENLLGCVVISTFEDLFYKEVTWLSNDDKPSVYIHRLAVHPDYQGQGIAQN